METVQAALAMVTFEHPDMIETIEPSCRWPRLCGDSGCTFPRYYRNGHPNGLVAHVLAGLGYPHELLKALDCEYEIGEVLHPGVRITNARNVALTRMDDRGRALLGFCQAQQRLGFSWRRIAHEAFRPRRMVQLLDARRRPWLY